MGYEANGYRKSVDKNTPIKMNGRINSGEVPRSKVVIVGDGGSGKTSLLIVFTQGEFPEEYVPTVFENYTAETKVEDQRVHLLLWDTAGQEDYDRLRPLSYDRADVIIMCYDVMSISSFENISIRWAPEIRHFCPGVPAILVGCKTDLRRDVDLEQSLKQQGREIITTEKGQKLAKDIGVNNFLECSAKTTDNVDNVFRVVSRLAVGLDTNNNSGKSPVLFNNCSNCNIL
ncbi:ras-like GTP-binding protein RHO [Styela clava]|uniref:ras-like GTP-binding protein RHO n=1 Tax=Styela clava TaxID=7725 RepID=UPI00193A4145|nr:ras-like GTP-binding protein RHO [Styela clava]